jgi:hypothetical protein
MMGLYTLFVKMIMTDKTFNYQINVPNGCMAKTVVTPIKMLSQNPHIRTFSEGLVRVATDKELNYTDTRVLLFISGIVDYENILNISQKELSQGLGIVQQEISKSIKKLIERDYLRIIGKIGRQNVYRLSPYFAFKSRAKNYPALCRDWDDNATDEGDE